MMTTLDKAQTAILAHHKYLGQRGYDIEKPPYSADAPCYYCCLRDEAGKDICSYCIQNPDSAVYNQKEYLTNIQESK